MTLLDKEILELTELCGAVADGTLTEAQRARLAAWLAESEAARRHYVRLLGQSASLHTYAAEMQAEAPDAQVEKTRGARWWGGWRWAALPAAAVVALGFWWAGFSTPTDEAPAREFVARLTGTKNTRWTATEVRPGGRLAKDQHLELAAGLAEVTFDSGARVVLEGPASLDVDSAWSGTLRRGTAKVSVPPEAIGFRLSNPAVEVVDLGTEFTMIADGAGAAEVLVLKGEVEAAPRAAADQEAILLRARESRRFAATGVSDVTDRDQKFARFTQPQALEYVATTVNYVHWSFDEAGGAVAKAETRGAAAGGSDAEIVAGGADARTEGRRARALRFDGKVFAKAPVPGLSNHAAHTIAFWVKVPEDAQLSDAYSMATWGLNSRKLGRRHVGINWNKDPADGPLGAVRTDFRGGHAIGTTTLRDGHWHHVTVVFAPGDGEAPEVRQYVDGRLESSTSTRDAMHGTARETDREAVSALTDMLWLGCRLGVDGQRKGRFRGEMDELFVADGALSPQEIVSLMNTNRLPAAMVAAK